MATAVLEEIQLPVIKKSAWSEFFEQHGRVPTLGDAKAPWKYPGWLLYYRMEAENHPEIASRWDYWSRTILAGQLLDEPIPELDFSMGAGEKAPGYKEVDKWMNLADSMDSRSPINDLLDWLLWGFGVSTTDPKLSDKTSEALYRGVNLGPVLTQPYDYLGEWIAMHKGKWNPHAFYPTPHSVVEMMTRMTFAGTSHKESRGQSVCDPALGSARMLLHASNYSLCLYGCDIDPMMVKVAKVNGALYVPWLVRPFPSEFFEPRPEGLGIEQRDSIRNPPTR